MPAPPPAFYATNVLDAAVLTLSPDGAVPGRGPERLVDRDIGRECEDVGVAGLRTWEADRGLDAPAELVHVWILAGTGIAGVPFTLLSSDDGLAWAPRGTVTPTADTPTRLVLDPFAVPRFVRWTVDRSARAGSAVGSVPLARAGIQMETRGGDAPRTSGLERQYRRLRQRAGLGSPARAAEMVERVRHDERAGYRPRENARHSSTSSPTRRNPVTSSR